MLHHTAKIDAVNGYNGISSVLYPWAYSLMLLLLSACFAVEEYIVSL
jgi:hypothetical protein